MATIVPSQFGETYDTDLRYDVFARAQILSARGYAIVTNGRNPNVKIDPDTGEVDLIMRAPPDEIYPALTGPSTQGKVFGNGLRWRVRYKNSLSGECSGLSPLPSVRLNLGVLVVPGSADYLGEIAKFTIEGTDTFGVDTIELFRNTSEGSVDFLVVSAANPGAGNYVTLEDNRSDAEISDGGIDAALFPNPSYDVPHPPPCVHAFEMPSGMIALYGMLPMGPYRNGYVTGTKGTNTLTGTNNARWDRCREGQMFRFIGGSDTTVYRIIEVLTTSTLRVSPVLQADAITQSYEIFDDRDARNAYLLQAVSPAQVDPADVLTIGQDRSDSLMYMFAIGGVTYALTRSRIYRLINDNTDQPLLTTRLHVEANIGCVGLWAATMTPFGCVFVSEKKGVMLFDGSGQPVPLGTGSPLADFTPKTQFERMEPSYLSDVLVTWNESHKRLVVAYCHTDTALSVEQLVFDPAVGWRGPWRRPVFIEGELREASGERVRLYGDQLGNIIKDEDGETDIIGSVLTGTVLTKDSAAVFTATAAVLPGSCEGAPIIFDDGAGNRYLNWIAVTTTGSQAMTLAALPSGLAAGWTFKVGAILWELETAHIDAGEPVQPKHLQQLRLRFQAAADPDSFSVKAAADGADLPVSADGTPDAVGTMHAEIKPHIGGHTFRLGMHGVASYGQPRITRAIVDMDVRDGAAAPGSTDSSKRTVLPA